MTRVMVRLDAQEQRALWHWAEIERRDPRAQAALLIRRALESAGYLKMDSLTKAPDTRQDAARIGQVTDAEST